MKNHFKIICFVFILSSCTEDKPVVIDEPVQENVNETGEITNHVKDTIERKVQ